MRGASCGVHTRNTYLLAAAGTQGKPKPRHLNSQPAPLTLRFPDRSTVYLRDTDSHTPSNHPAAPPTSSPPLGPSGSPSAAASAGGAGVGDAAATPSAPAAVAASHTGDAGGAAAAAGAACGGAALQGTATRSPIRNGATMRRKPPATRFCSTSFDANASPTAAGSRSPPMLTPAMVRVTMPASMRAMHSVRVRRPAVIRRSRRPCGGRLVAVSWLVAVAVDGGG
jgi:hypothetical protein